MDDLIKSQVKKKYKVTIKIQYDNGANETIYPCGALNVNPLTPMIMDYPIKRGHTRHVNLSKVRSMDTFIEEDVDLHI